MPGHAHGKRKKLGQCFLVDDQIAGRIILEAGVKPGGGVLEVGPGRGILTRRLLAAGAVVHAVELDRELYGQLQRDMGGAPNLSLEKGNALRFDFDSFPPPYKIVSNLPYSVSVALIKRFIANKPRISDMTLMTQAEVAGRLTAQAGQSHYGSLSLFINYHCQTQFLFAVPPDAFRPRPKVESAVLRLIPRQTPAVIVDDEDDFFRFVQTAFVHRRKTMRNNLKGIWRSVEEMNEAFIKAGVDPSTRPEDVSVEQFAALYREWIKDGGMDSHISP